MPGMRFFLSLIALASLTSSAFAQPSAPASTPAAVNTAAIPSDDASTTDKHQAYTRERYQKYMEKLATTPRPIDLIFDGDSITDGWQGRGIQVWNANFANRRAFDFGISGDRTQHVLWRLDQGQVKGLDPKLIAIMIGTNNIGSHSAEQIAEGVAAIVAKYRDLCPNATILLQAIFPRGETPDNPARLKIKEINKLIAPLGDTRNVIYIDFGDKFLQPDGTMSKEIMPDFLHPSPQGYEIWAEAIKPIIEKYAPAN
jgi:lysophospholipase L1-like esterase